MIWLLLACCEPPADGRIAPGTYGGDGIELRVRMDSTADVLLDCDDTHRIEAPMLLEDGAFTGVTAEGAAVAGQACGDTIELDFDGQQRTLTLGDNQLDCSF